VGLLRVWLPSAVLGARESSVAKDCTHSVLAGSTYAFWNQHLIHSVWRREARNKVNEVKGKDWDKEARTAQDAIDRHHGQRPGGGQSREAGRRLQRLPPQTTDAEGRTLLPQTNRIESWRELQAMVVGVKGERCDEGTWSGVCSQSMSHEMSQGLNSARDSAKPTTTRNRRAYLPAPKLCGVTDL